MATPCTILPGCLTEAIPPYNAYSLENGGIRPRERKRSVVPHTRGERSHLPRTWRSYQCAQCSDPTGSISIYGKSGNSSQWRLSSYRASLAEEAAWQRALRPKACKLVNKPRLARIVAVKFRRLWSPEQIAGWLKRQFPEHESHRVSHETIYKSLFIQARGVLKKELMTCLRTQRIARRSKYTSKKGKGLGKIVDAVPISERPASVEDRAVPGHWEGDLIEGSNKTFIATLVERQTPLRDAGQGRKQENGYGDQGPDKASPQSCPMNCISH